MFTAPGAAVRRLGAQGLAPCLDVGRCQLGQLQARELGLVVDVRSEAGFHVLGGFAVVALGVLDVLDVVLARAAHGECVNRAAFAEVFKPSLSRLLCEIVPLARGDVRKVAQRLVLLLCGAPVRALGQEAGQPGAVRALADLAEAEIAALLHL